MTNIAKFAIKIEQPAATMNKCQNDRTISSCSLLLEIPTKLAHSNYVIKAALEQNNYVILYFNLSRIRY